MVPRSAYSGHMRSISVGMREAKAGLSRYVERARQGHVVTITVRGRGVARLVPVPDAERTTEDRIKDLEAAGVLQPFGRGRRIASMKPVEARPFGIAQRILQEHRGR